MARCSGLLEASFFDLAPELQEEYRPLLEPWFVARIRRIPGGSEAPTGDIESEPHS